ncbi:MAG: lipoyl synthase [Myxococcales bacterium]|nr:lipoyl synthase [Myxococcales bacterium]
MDHKPPTPPDAKRERRATVARPPWPMKRLQFTEEVHDIKRLLRAQKLRTVCEDARCPNISECFSRREATFMILGKHCTRSCAFCAIPTGRGEPPDPEEPRRLAAAAQALGLSHVVITSVARDDLPDEGAGHFKAVVDAIRERSPSTTVEILTPDFHARDDCLDVIARCDLAIFNHNMETVPSLYRAIRPQAKYDRSLQVLAGVKARRPDVATKSGFMLGLGESDREVLDVMRDMRDAGVDILTIGQYMQPRKRNADVDSYATLERFDALREAGEELGFPLVLSAPYVRSSFGAAEAKRALEQVQRHTAH